MSEFKIRPTPTLIRLILEQLEANGVDTNQKSLAIGANLHSETQKEPYFFLRGLSMPLTAGVGFISEKPTEKNALCFLQSCGFLTGNAFDTTVGATLHLEAMRNVISQGKKRRITFIESGKTVGRKAQRWFQQADSITVSPVGKRGWPCCRLLSFFPLRGLPTSAKPRAIWFKPQRIRHAPFQFCCRDLGRAGTQCLLDRGA
jgi:hypothetical protein